MTDMEFIEALEKACSYKNPNRTSDIRKLANMKQFSDFLYQETASTGMTETDEMYLYNDNKLLSTIGSRMSWFGYLSDEPPIDLKDEHFPFVGERFVYNDNVYWLLTMWGQGSMSWIETDELFQANKRERE